MINYVIVGDTEKYKNCLVTVCRSDKKEFAEKRLEQMLTNPTENDLRLMKGHTNFRIMEAKEEEQWWNDKFLMAD